MALVLWVALVAIATLTPSASPGINVSGPWCLACGDLGALDALYNVILFVPLGAALAALGRPVRVAGAIGLGVTLVIELLQFFVIPGRDGTLSDVLTNTTGSALGALAVRHFHLLWSPSPSVAPRLQWAAAVLPPAVAAATLWLQQPDAIHMDYFGQWAPSHAQFASPTATPATFFVNDIAIGRTLLPERERLLRAYRATDADFATSFSAGAHPDRLAAIVRIASWRTELLLLGQRAGDAVVRYRTRATAARVRTLAFALPGAIPAGDPSVTFAVRRDARGLTLRATDSRGSARVARIDFDPLLGWAMLAPRPIVLTPALLGLGGVWAALLLFPCAWWGRCRSAPLVARVAPVLASALATLVIIPAVMGSVPAGPAGWVGALAAIAATTSLPRRLR